jgi:hypothetical protein
LRAANIALIKLESLTHFHFPEEVFSVSLKFVGHHYCSPLFLLLWGRLLAGTPRKCDSYHRWYKKFTCHSSRFGTRAHWVCSAGAGSGRLLLSQRKQST